jgi:aspartyl-tRNA(Asn)/glutamyl-tRNA(Gln) amidotransferase subunit A
MTTTAQEDLAYLPATEALRLFRIRELSPVELLDAVLTRAEATEPAVGAVTAWFADEARDQARAAETRYARGRDTRPLEGLPVAMKDEIPIAGQPWTDGSLVHRSRVAAFTAPVAARIIDAGGIVHIRTTTPEFCCAGFTHSKLWGVTRNPWDPTLASGGSSGGSGAALAAGAATLATGSDIGGSIRVPAAMNGVIGFKPPFGRVPDIPPFNLDPYCQNGPMARTVADTALLQNVISGPHRQDAATLRSVSPIPEELAGIEGWKVGLSPRLGGYAVEPDVARNTAFAADALQRAGATIVDLDLRWDPIEIRRLAFAHYGTVLGPTLQDQIADHPDLVNDYTVAFAEQAAREAARLPLVEALQLEHELHMSLADVFDRCDVLLCPTVAVTSLEAGRSYAGETPVIGGIEFADYMDAFLTMGFIFAGRCPVLAVPSGRTSAGAPTGVQLVGRTYDDVAVFRAAAALERIAGPWFADAAHRPGPRTDGGAGGQDANAMAGAARATHGEAG